MLRVREKKTETLPTFILLIPIITLFLILGELQSATFVNADNKQRQSFQVRVNEIYASKAESSETKEGEEKSIDHNNVCILSHIASDIAHFENHSVFNLCGHYITKYLNKFFNGNSNIPILYLFLQGHNRRRQ